MDRMVKKSSQFAVCQPLPEKIQKDIKKRTLNYRIVQRREKIEREFEKMLQDK
jgi:hypothetical protein